MAFNVHPPSVPSLHEASGFLGAFVHLRNAIDLIWNRTEQRLIWNDWTELLFKTWIETLHDPTLTHENPVTGPSSSWKSTCAAVYANAFWAASPLRTKIIISSTTMGGLRERIWKDILSYYNGSGFPYGNVIQHPSPKIQTVKGDDSTGIHGIAIEQGDVNKAIDKIKGRHAPRVLVVIDEGTGAQPAIVESCVNLRTGTEDFQLQMLFNAGSYFDEAGKLSEPKDGWGSISVESEKWETRRGGIAIHLDGHKAPNVLAGYQKYPGMISQSDLDNTALQYGENSPRYWQERRGFWPPEGLANTVLSESMFVKFKAGEKPLWVGDYTLGAALDPGYGGDRCVLRFGRCGLITEENEPRWAIGLDGYMVLPIDVRSKEPPHYQIARQVREECKARSIPPFWFALDSSGIGDGTSNIFKREWSSEFLDVKFGGYASELPVSDINPRPSREEYVNKVTELWFGFRVAVERNQIRGLDLETAKEFCQRKADYKKHAPRVVVEPKSEMKARYGRSPDLADSAVILVELFRRRMKDLGRGDARAPARTRWSEFLKKRNFEINYALAE